MKTIEKYSLNKLTNAAFAILVSNAVDYNTLHIDPETMSNMVPFADDLKKKIETYNELFKQTESSEKTDKIEILDNQRDALLSGLNNMIDGYLKHPNLELKDAAHAVRLKIDGYGKALYKRPYLDETQIIRSIVDDLRSEEFTAYVTLLGISQWIVDLDTSNEKFLEVYNARSTDRENHIKGGVRESRKEAQHSFSTFCDMVNSNIKVNGEALYSDLVKHYNEIITEAFNANNQRGPHEEKITKE